MSLLDFIDFEEVKETVVPVYQEEEEEKSIDIFYILKAITETKEDLDFSKICVRKAYDKFRINKWLSMNEVTIIFVEDINNLHNITDEQHFQILKSLLPKRKFYYDYAKMSKDLTHKDIRYIANYFEIGLSDAENYIRVMTDDDIDSILDKYRYGKNGKEIIKI